MTQVEQPRLQRLLREYDVSDIGVSETPHGKAVIDGATGKVSIVFEPRISFFLCGADDLIIDHHGRVGVVAQRAAYAEDDGRGRIATTY